MHLSMQQVLTVFTMFIVAIKYAIGKNVAVNVCVYPQYITDYVCAFLIY